MRRFLLLCAAVATIGSSSDPQKAAAARDGWARSSDVLEMKLQAPFSDLFARARSGHEGPAGATLSYRDAAGHDVAIESVMISVRGHTSLEPGECEFPKLKLDFRSVDRPQIKNTLFARTSTIKLGTHCADRPDRTPTIRYGRLGNDRSPFREAFVYRLLAAMDVPSLLARPIRMTYADTGGGDAIVRDALLVEDDDQAVRRYGAHEQFTEKTFSSATDHFAPADGARLLFAEAMIGNFDWCVRWYDGDTYRCDDRHAIWNVLALKRRSDKALPVLFDFDVSGMVVGRHSWFAQVFNRDFIQGGSEPDIEVLAQLQRSRTLFARDVLDRTRAEFARHEAVAYRELGSAVMDDDGRKNATAYLKSFFSIIKDDSAFYRPVVVGSNARLYTSASRTQTVCGEGWVPQGTAVRPLETQGDMMRVTILDVLWHWAPPVWCIPVQSGSVWVSANSVSTGFPH